MSLFQNKIPLNPGQMYSVIFYRRRPFTRPCFCCGPQTCSRSHAVCEGHRFVSKEFPSEINKVANLVSKSLTLQLLTFISHFPGLFCFLICSVLVLFFPPDVLLVSPAGRHHRLWGEDVPEDVSLLLCTEGQSPDQREHLTGDLPASRFFLLTHKQISPFFFLK